MGSKDSDLPAIILCFKKEQEKNKGSKDKKDTSEEKSSNRPKKRSKSRELRNGILYVGCDCERRNGLQDQCPRTGCHGSPDCMIVPPRCGPSEFAQAKHIAKKYEKILRDRAKFAKEKKYNNPEKPKSGKHGVEKSIAKIDYDCYPLDGVLQAGFPCPICEKPLEICPSKPISIGPVLIDFPVDCLCCPSAS